MRPLASAIATLLFTGAVFHGESAPTENVYSGCTKTSIEGHGSLPPTGAVGVFVPPTLSGPVEHFDSQHFRLHYTLKGEDAVLRIDRNADGLPDYVQATADVLERVHSVETQDLGWAPPPSDCGWGGNALYDVFIRNLLGTENSYGFVKSGANETRVGDNPETQDVVESRSSFSYMELDNTFHGDSGLSPAKLLRTVVAHEYLHAIQFGYDGEEPAGWLWEATANWIEDEVFDSINQIYGDLDMVFKAPDLAQNGKGFEAGTATGSDRWYGQWIFFRYLSERFGHSIVRAIWEHARHLDGYDAIEGALVASGTDLTSVVQGFSIALLTRNFEEGENYPTVDLEGSTGFGEFRPVDGVAQLGADYLAITASGVVTILLRGSGLEGTVVGITGDKATQFNMPGNIVTINTDQFEELYLIVLNPTPAFTPEAAVMKTYRVNISPATDPLTDTAVPTKTGLAANFETPKVSTRANARKNQEIAIYSPAHLVPPDLPEGFQAEGVFEIFRDGISGILLQFGNGEAFLDIVIREGGPTDLKTLFVDEGYKSHPGTEFHLVNGMVVLLEDFGETRNPYSRAAFVSGGQAFLLAGHVSVDNLLDTIRSLIFAWMD
jgi:hypothetical protein